MPIFENRLEDFRLWQAELTAAPPEMPEFADRDDPVALALAEMEYLLLRTQVNEINQYATALNYQKGSSMHTICKTNGYFKAHVTRAIPLGKPVTMRYFRVVVNEVAEDPTNNSMADIADYFVDLQAVGVSAYYGSAELKNNKWELAEKSPAIIFGMGFSARFVSAANYKPRLPVVSDESTTFEQHNQQRQAADVLIDILSKLGPATLDFEEPYTA